jgi:hypothetical protein
MTISGLSQDNLRTASGQLQDNLRTTSGQPQDNPNPSACSNPNRALEPCANTDVADNSNVLSKPGPDSPRIASRDCLRTVSGQPQGCLRTTSGLSQDNLRTVSRQPQDCLRTTSGLSQDNLRIISGQPQDCPEAVLALSLPSGQSSKQCPALPLTTSVM